MIQMTKNTGDEWLGHELRRIHSGETGLRGSAQRTAGVKVSNRHFA